MRECIIREKPCNEENIDPNLCFVSIASSDELVNIKKIVVDTLHEFSMNEYIAEDLDIMNKEIFCEKICSKILRSRFCIIVLTEATPRGKTSSEPNPNVYFEYGLATAVRKIVIPLYPEPANKAPFNIRNLGLAEYSLSEKSDRYIKNVLDSNIEKARIDTQSIIESQEKFGSEEGWYRNYGGIVYNVLLPLKDIELYLQERNSIKFQVDRRDNLKSFLCSHAKHLLTYSTEEIFNVTFPIKNELIEIARNLDKLGRADFTFPYKEFEEIAAKSLILIDSLIKKNIGMFKKIGIYLIHIDQTIEEMKKHLETLKLRWERIDEDLFLVQNAFEIASSCESFARDLVLLSSNVIYDLSPADCADLNEIIKGFMELHLREVSDGGIGMKVFRDSYKKLIKRCEDSLNRLKTI